MTCSYCGVHKDDPARDFYPLWFTTTTTHAPLCPPCASAQLAARSGNMHIHRIVGAEADLGPAPIARTSGH
jgi:hypothetical protein